MNVDERKDLRALESCHNPNCGKDAIRGEYYCAECKLKAIAIIKKDLANFYTALQNKILVKVPEYGASYRDEGCSIDFLERRLREEIVEHAKNPYDPSELVDIAAICMMIHSKLKKN